MNSDRWVFRANTTLNSDGLINLRSEIEAALTSASWTSVALRIKGMRALRIIEERLPHRMVMESCAVIARCLAE